jgi:hypothetical protein
MANDSWCRPLWRAGLKRPLAGGAARNVRIADAGGMDQIIGDVSDFAARKALNDANLAMKHSAPAVRKVRAAKNPPKTVGLFNKKPK